MERVIKAVEAIKTFDGVSVDCNYLQGEEAFAEQLRKNRYPFGFSDEYTFRVLQTSQRYINELKDWIAPYAIPDDYLFFLENYGGLSISGNGWRFTIDGLGPMTHEWYDDLMNPDELFFIPVEDGVIEIGLLIIYQSTPKSSRYINYCLDLKGEMHKNGVVNLGVESDNEQPPTRQVAQYPHQYPRYWRKCADSFVEWLERIVELDGDITRL